MKKGWDTKPLGDICPVTNRKPKPFAGTRSYYSTGAVGPEGELSEPETVDFENRPSRAGCMPETGDIGFARMKGTKKGILIDESLCGSLFSTGFCFIAPSQRVVPRYAFYFITSNRFQDAKDSAAGDGIMGGIKNSDAESIEIPVPPTAEQQRIVGVLDAAFTELATAQSNAERNLQNARALFESCLQLETGDNVALGDLVDIKTGKIDANAAVEDGKYPFFTCSRDTYAIDRYAFDCEAVLLAGNNAVGDFNVKHFKGKFNAYQRTYVITVNSKQKALCRYIFHQLRKNLAKFKSQSVGAGTKFLKLAMIKDMVIPLPDVSEQAQIVELLDAVLGEVEHLARIYEQKQAALAELKKSLLHQAFSGNL